MGLRFVITLFMHLRGLFLKEIIQIFFSNPVNASEFNAFKILTANELEYRQVMKLQRLCDLFRCQQPLNHA